MIVKHENIDTNSKRDLLIIDKKIKVKNKLNEEGKNDNNKNNENNIENVK